jgi:hypothetical protein
LDRAHDALHVTISIVGVIEAGKLRRIDDIAYAGQHSPEAGKSQVRQRVPGGKQSRAVNVERFKACLLDQAR